MTPDVNGAAKPWGQILLLKSTPELSLDDLHVSERKNRMNLKLSTFLDGRSCKFGGSFGGMSRLSISKTAMLTPC